MFISGDNIAAASTASSALLIVAIFAVMLTLLLGVILAMSITIPLYKSLAMIQELR